MTPNCKIHPVPATGTCNKCRSFVCEKCARVGNTCPYCKLDKIVPAAQMRKAVDNCANHPGIKAAARCPLCERIFCTSCFNPLGQCFECGARAARLQQAAGPRPAAQPAPERSGARSRRPKRQFLGTARAVIGMAILIGVGTLINWQYQALKAAVPGNKARPGAIGGAAGAYNKKIEAHGKDLDDIMGRIESGQYSEADMKSVDDLLAKATGQKDDATSLDPRTRERLEAIAEARRADLENSRPHAQDGPDDYWSQTQEYDGPPIRLRGGGGREKVAQARPAERRAERRAAPRAAPLAVAIVSPAGGARLRGTTVVSANLSGSGIDRVEFQVNGQWQGLSNRPPYRFDWDTTSVRNGPVSLRVVAYDTGGKPHGSKTIRVTVQN